MKQHTPELTGFQFGPFQLDLNGREIRKGSLRIKLQEQPLRVLALLAARPGELVTRAEIKEQIWGEETFVDFENGLNFCIRKIRALLGDDWRMPRYIETVRRVGYRFLESVEEVNASKLGQSWQGFWSRNPQRGRAITVLLNPFREERNPGQRQLGEGIGELVAVSLLQTQQIRVLLPSESRNETAADAVLDGAVAWGKDRVRVTASLTQLRTRRLVWAESYERDLRDLLALQREIALSIATELKIRLVPREQTARDSKATAKSEAIEEYLKGRFFWNKRTEQALTKGIDHFRNAVEKDPSYALGYVGLADSYNMLGHYVGPPKEIYPRAKAEAIRAIKIDDTLVEARTSLAFVTFIYDWDWFSAETEFQRAIELNPRHANAHHWYALYLAAMGRLEEAQREINRARDLDPLSLIIEETVGWILHFAGHYDSAIEHYYRTLDFDPDFMPAHEGLGLAFEQKGMFEEAIMHFEKAMGFSQRTNQLLAAQGHTFGVSGKRELARGVLDQLRQIAKERYVSPHSIALVHTSLGEKERALAWFEKAYSDRSTGMIWVKVEPRLARLRPEKRFQTLLGRMGFPAL